jgi:ATP-dependent Lhr-like helicase
MLASLEQDGRVVRARLTPESPEVLLAREDVPLYAALYPRCTFTVPLTGDRGPLPAGDRQVALKEIVRHALATSAPVTVTELEERLGLNAADLHTTLVTLEAQGAVFRGQFTNRQALSRENAGRETASTEQWCDRYVLERIHRQTLHRLRAEVEPCADHHFAAFRCRWQGLDEADADSGADGVRRALEQLSGLAYPPAFWESAILPARVAGYRPEYLDLLCMSGEFAWVAAPMEDDAASAGEFPARIAFVPRRGPSMDGHQLAAVDERDAPVREVLRNRGAQYLDQVAERVGLSERDTLAALWRLAAAGLASNDSFAPLRLIAAVPGAARSAVTPDVPRAASRLDVAVRARLKSSLSGRWSLIEPLCADALEHEVSTTDRVREVAEVLLARHGILAREMLVLEQTDVGWRELSFVLRRMEYAGLIRRGWFVRALSGEQYAMPAALQMLNAIRATAGDNKFAVFSALDPANPYGVLLPGCGVMREASNLLVVRGGRVFLGLSGRDLFAPEPLDAPDLRSGLGLLMRMRPKLSLETIDGVRALDSVQVGVLAGLGFHSDGRALLYDGLPGPLPARAASSASHN